MNYILDLYNMYIYIDITLYMIVRHFRQHAKITTDCIKLNV